MAAEGETVAAVMERYMKATRMRDADVANLTGLTRSAINQMRHGLTRPKPDNLRLVARALATDPLDDQRHDEQLERRIYLDLMVAAEYLDRDFQTVAEGRNATEIIFWRKCPACDARVHRGSIVCDDCGATLPD